MDKRDLTKVCSRSSAWRSRWLWQTIVFIDHYRLLDCHRLSENPRTIQVLWCSFPAVDCWEIEKASSDGHLCSSVSLIGTVCSTECLRESINAWTMTKTVLSSSAEESHRDNTFERFINLFRYEIAFDNWHSDNNTENCTCIDQYFLNAIVILIGECKTEATDRFGRCVHDHRRWSVCPNHSESPVASTSRTSRHVDCCRKWILPVHSQPSDAFQLLWLLLDFLNGKDLNASILLCEGIAWWEIECV